MHKEFEKFVAPPEPKLRGETEEVEEKFLSDKDADLSYTREKLFEDAKRQSGLDDGTFDEMAKSFEVLESLDPNMTNESDWHSFKIHGHQVLGSRNESLLWKVDDVTVNSEQSKSLLNKYRKAISGLRNLHNQRIERLNTDSVVEDLLR